MRVIVLGIDGLDADLVLRWRLKAFMQQYYGTHDVRVAVKPGDPLYTPLIWASFLLGKPAYEYGFTHEEIVKRRDLTAYRKFGPLYSLRLKIFGKRSLHLRKIMMKLGLYDRESVVKKFHEVEALPEEALRDTFPEIAKREGFKVWAEEFPSYNEVKFAEWRARASEYLGLSLREKLKALDERTDYSIKLLDRAINAAQDHDLILYYTSVIDWANHKLYRPKSLTLMTFLASYYKKFEKLISKAERKLKKSAILIVSDHGYDPRVQEHSSKGFWSLNIKPPITPKTILDFKGLILELLRC